MTAKQPVPQPRHPDDNPKKNPYARRERPTWLIKENRGKQYLVQEDTQTYIRYWGIRTFISNNKYHFKRHGS